ncbi:MAG: hypothetical protein P0Y49_11525 [Candidatus Pedobacter colombiensis]|uniref:Uncharacterized protein n=1 Tax=Candidatus Pedobacter colombiensis TaxID=3121371 RepID=A0AAJ5W3K6_9SPHI|nr:hypothetical protein [Pedobacter sp.]WEK17424.1 MAG: hypothetical protein P0Y49_11525 [Pedobacter sp.]
MSLKAIIDGIIRDKHRSLSWLAISMGKTFDGLRLGLINESIKYKDILLMAEILEVSPCCFFKSAEDLDAEQNMVAEAHVEYGDLKATLKSCKELVATLKDQINDKERIITLLTKEQPDKL